MQVLHLDGLESSDLGRSIKHYVHLSVNEDVEVAYYVIDECLAFGSDEHAVCSGFRHERLYRVNHVSSLEDAV